MTDEQKAQVLSLYKEGYTFYHIWETTGVNGNTAAAFLRRNHPKLVRNSKDRQEALLKGYATHFQEKLAVPHTTAVYMAETTFERFKNKKGAAKASGTEFNIEYKEIEFPSHCPILGIELDYCTTQHKADNYPTFDRIDNNKGYVNNNVHVVSWRANRLKSNGTREDFTKLVEFLNKVEEKT